MPDYEHIINPEVQAYIQQHHGLEVESLILQKPVFDNLSNQELAEQLKAKHKAKVKLPSLFQRQDIIYPKDLNLQQSSSELTANYKADLLPKHARVADLTGGFGIDSIAFSKSAKQVYYVEPHKKLLELTTYNFNRLGLKHVNAYNTTDIEFLNQHKPDVDVLFIDPSRRNKEQKKVFLISDCSPNVIEHLDLYFTYAKHVFIKLSPLFDLKKLINDLKWVKEIHVISVKNEVKELLIILEKNYTQEVKIKCVDLNTHLEKVKTFKFDFNTEEDIKLSFEQPRINNYLIEPKACVLKAGAFKTFANHYGIKKLGKHTHLYTSTQPIEQDLARVFKVVSLKVYKPKQLKRHYNKTKANISTRNFPLSVSNIKQKLNILDGGHTYLFFTTDFNHTKLVIETIKA